MSNKKIVWIAIVYFTVFALVVVLYIRFSNLDVQKAGSTGDAFNGLLTPFISFAGALLVYLSFKAQIEANSKQIDAIAQQADALREQRTANAQQVEALNEQRIANQLLSNQWLLDTYLRMLDDLKQDYEKIEVQTGSTKARHLGVHGMHALAHTAFASIYRLPEGLNQLSILLAEILFLSEKLRQTPVDRIEFVLHKLHLWLDLCFLPYLPYIRNQIVGIQKKDEYQYFINRIDKVIRLMFTFKEKDEEKPTDKGEK